MSLLTILWERVGEPRFRATHDDDLIELPLNPANQPLTKLRLVVPVEMEQIQGNLE